MMLKPVDVVVPALFDLIAGANSKSPESLVKLTSVALLSFRTMTWLALETVMLLSTVGAAAHSPLPFWEAVTVALPAPTT